MDEFDRLHRVLQKFADAKGIVEGLPIPLDDFELIVADQYPNADVIRKFHAEREAKADEELPHVPKRTLHGGFWSSFLRTEVITYWEDGKFKWGVLPSASLLSMEIHTSGCTDAWGMVQEERALELLSTLISPRQYKRYFLTGVFHEKSARSGLIYVFRRLRPTVAISPAKEQVRVLAALCLHPIGFYQGTFGGALCPTDDVIAHLTLMRGDEAAFWKRSSQHAPWRPQSGMCETRFRPALP